VLTGKLKLERHNIEYPLPWVPYQDVKMCQGDRFENGCNVFPSGRVPPLFIDTSLDGTLLPELSLASIQEGKATPGAQMQTLPPVKYADNLPDVNCSNCTAPPDAMEPNLVKSIRIPK
jgi:ribose transport system substrate-binding protein